MGASTPFQYFADHAGPELGLAISSGRCSEFAAFAWSVEEVLIPQDLPMYARS